MNSDSENPRDRARLLRSQCTKEEALLWKRLRGKRFGGFKFRRQQPVGPYFADLCCVQKRLIVELDGGQHAEQTKRDAARTAYLAGQGYRVIRFWNEQVNREMEDVLEAIHAALTDRAARKCADKGPSLGA